MSGHGKARDEKRKKRIRAKRNAETTLSHQVDVVSRPPSARPGESKSQKTT